MSRLSPDQKRDVGRDEALERGAFYRLEARRFRFYRVYPCKCRSPWCESCSVSSPTNEEIRRRLGLLDWRKVRHVILTVGRDRPPAEVFEEIREKRAVARGMKALGIARWLWILEFHRGGFPHWHVLAEGKGGMIGHDNIKSAWSYGHVWESPIKDSEHWRRIMGYHQGKGYLAGEKKAHQLILPPFLLDQNRVRKFGANYGAIHAAQREEGGGASRRSKTYREAQSTCGLSVRIVSGGESFHLSKRPEDVYPAFRENLEAVNKTLFVGKPSDYRAALDAIFMPKNVLSGTNHADGSPASPITDSM